MEGLGVVLFVAAMIVSTIIEQAKKRSKGPPGPTQPPRRVPPRLEDRLPGPRTSAPTLPAPSDGRASDMVNEDFWRELTGQPRRSPPPVERHAPEEMPGPDLPSWDEEAVAEVEEQSREVTRREERSLEEYRRPEVVRAEPKIIVLDSPPPPPEKRHAAFHRRVELPAVAAAPLAAPGLPLKQRLRTRSGLRESFVLQEVFGPPKALRDDPDR